MEKTHCGKNCDTCSLKAELHCPGCMTGPGRAYGGDCSIAKCCREKGHESCDTCVIMTNCLTIQNRGQMAKWRKDKIESDAMYQNQLAERSIILGKWLSILFWLIVPATIGSIMGNNNFATSAPVVFIIGTSLNALASIIYGAILLKISSVEDTYHPAGVCILISSFISILSIILSKTPEIKPILSFVSTVGAVISLIGQYKEYKAHSYILTGINDTLSGNWILLWKWYIGCMIAMLSSIVLVLIAPLLAVLVIIGSIIGIIVVSIMKLVYLYQTAAALKDYHI